MVCKRRFSKPVKPRTSWQFRDGRAALLRCRNWRCSSTALPISIRENPWNLCQTPPVKLFYTGPVVNAEMLVVMLDKHGIAATQSFADPAAPDDGDLSRPAQVFVPEADYDRAFQLFYAEREDEL